MYDFPYRESVRQADFSTRRFEVMKRRDTIFMPIRWLKEGTDARAAVRRYGRQQGKAFRVRFVKGGISIERLS